MFRLPTDQKDISNITIAIMRSMCMCMCVYMHVTGEAFHSLHMPSYGYLRRPSVFHGERNERNEEKEARERARVCVQSEAMHKHEACYVFFLFFRSSSPLLLLYRIEK